MPPRGVQEVLFADTLSLSLQKLNEQMEKMLASTTSLQKQLEAIENKVLPLFSGSNPRDWIHKAEKFFDYHHIPSYQRIDQSSRRFDSNVWLWFGEIVYEYDDTWDQFKDLLLQRFGTAASVDNCSSIDDNREACQVFDEMPGQVNATGGPDLAIKTVQFLHAFDMFGEMPCPNQPKDDELDSAVEVFVQMPTLTPRAEMEISNPDSAVDEIACPLERELGVLEVLDESAEYSDAATGQVLFIKTGQLLPAFEGFEEMPKTMEGLTGSEGINLSCKVFSKMTMSVNTSILPEIYSATYTCTVVMSGFAKGGLMDGIYKICSETQKRHTRLSHATHHTLIQGYCKMGEYAQALECMNDLQNTSVYPSLLDKDKPWDPGGLSHDAILQECISRGTDELVDGTNTSHITPSLLDRWESMLEDLFDGCPCDMFDLAFLRDAKLSGYQVSASLQVNLSCDNGNAQLVTVDRLSQKDYREKMSGSCIVSKEDNEIVDYLQPSAVMDFEKIMMLKNLWQRPNKLSEESVQCMRNIFLCLSEQPSTSKASSSKLLPSFSPVGHLSRSSLTSSLDSSIISSLATTELHLTCGEWDLENSFDPYFVNVKVNGRNIGYYGLAAEVCWMSIGKAQIDYAAEALKKFRFLVEQLTQVDQARMSSGVKLTRVIIANSVCVGIFLAVDKGKQGHAVSLFYVVDLVIASIMNDLYASCEGM